MDKSKHNNRIQPTASGPGQPDPSDKNGRNSPKASGGLK